MNVYDYSFFDKFIDKTRLLKGCHPYALVRGANETGTVDQLLRSPKIIIPADNQGENCIFEAASYATSPGHGLAKVQEMVGYPLPDDLLAFYERYEKALVVTRTYPLHMWHEDKIIEKIKWFREFFDKPFRVFRFGDQYDREATQFGMWLEEPGTDKWRIISTAIGIIDDMDDDNVTPDRIIGQNFYEWFKSWVERDGLPDPFMDLGPEGGFIDPPTQEDLARIAARQQGS